MFKLFLWILIAIIGVTLIRSIGGLLFRGLGSLMQPPPPAASRDTAENVPLSGELKKDPVCGIYISTATSLKKTVQGETVHFCSIACRDKYPS